VTLPCAGRCGQSVELPSCEGSEFATVLHERGIPSKRKSSACVDHVPALCTHRPSLLPIEWFNEILGSEDGPVARHSPAH